MGLLSKIRRRSKPSRSQADNPKRDRRTLEQKYIDAKAEVARLRALPTRAFRPQLNSATGIILLHSVDAKDYAVKIAESELAELEVRVKAQSNPEVRIKQ